MNGKTDRRIRKTKDTIRQGLIVLMKTKSISEITVKELTEKVDINRATFYNHYRDIFDLYESIENDMYDEFTRTLNRYTLHISARKGENRVTHSPMPLFLEIFQFLANNSDMCLFLLSERTNSEFIDKVMKDGKNKYLEEWKEIYHQESSELIEATYHFIAAGCIGLIRYWLANDMQQSASEMAAIAESMILFSMRILEQQV